MIKKTRQHFKHIVTFIIISWLLLFVLFPNLLIILTSFLTRDDANLIQYLFTFSNYARLLDPLYAEVLLNSLRLALIATFFCLLLGYPFAFILAQMPQRLRSVLLFLLILPFWTNSLMRLYGLKLFLGIKGYLNSVLLWLGILDQPFKIMYRQEAVILGFIYILLPFMILPIYSSIEKLDKTYLEAAQDLGANKLQRFRRITLPLTMPGIIAGCLLVLLPAMGLFYVADLLGGAKNLLIGNVIKTQFLNVRDWPFGSAVSIALTLIMALLLWIYFRASSLIHKQANFL